MIHYIQHGPPLITMMTACYTAIQRSRDIDIGITTQGRQSDRYGGVWPRLEGNVE